MAAITTEHGRPAWPERHDGSGVISAPAWMWAVLALSAGLLWLVTMEGSAVSQVVGGAPSFFHELFHDGRHLIGVPCH